MLDAILGVLSQSTKIVLIVTALMLITEFLELRFKDRIRRKITESPVTQIVIASLLGAIPGCMDASFVVSLYVHGLVGFGALTAVMLSTAGDEAFIMLAMIPEAALNIFLVCVPLGVVGGLLADRIVKLINLTTCQPCEIEIHEEGVDLKHFLKEHAYEHILKKHIPKLFIRIFSTMLAVDLLVGATDLESIVSGLPKPVLIVLAALIGVIPESGPPPSLRHAILKRADSLLRPTDQYVVPRWPRLTASSIILS